MNTNQQDGGPTPPPGMRLLAEEEYYTPLPNGSVVALGHFMPGVPDWVPVKRVGQIPFSHYTYAIPIETKEASLPAPGGESELKPCPFCGNSKTTTFETNDEYLEEDLPENQLYYKVVCDACDGGCGGCSGYKKTRAEALILWNTRA